LRYYKLDKKHGGIKDFDKIVWCNLKENPLYIESLALTGYDDPKEIKEFVDQYIDRETVFNTIFLNKLHSVYQDLGWHFPQLNPNVSKFFKLD
jgi:hypothetical protein